VEVASDVVFLAKFDGTDGATTATEQTGKALTFTGTAQIDTAQKKFGTASLLLASGDSVTTPDHADWYFPGAWTIETWIRPGTMSLGSASVVNVFGDTNNRIFTLNYNRTNATVRWVEGRFHPAGNATGAVILASSNFTPDESVFHHLAFTRDGIDGDFRLFWNGALVAGPTNSTQPGGFNGNTGLVIGVLATYNNFVGWIDSIRITNGTALYTAAFTAPTTDFPDL
jgi:hypothetical protein